MNIRPAQPRDLEACLALDESFETEYVWQIETMRSNGVLRLGFRTTRLPRPMRVPGQSPRQAIAEHLEQGEGFFVAEEYPRLCGFADATRDPWQRLAWIHHLIVAPDLRRRGIGGQLLQAVLAWAQAQNLRTVMASVSTKNYPGSVLLQKYGFTFCGFNDRYFPNRDIALFFAYDLR